MQALGELLVILLILLNFRLLGTSQLGTAINTIAIQALVLCAFPILTAPAMPGVWTMVMVGLAIVIKAGVLPTLVRRAMNDTGVVRELEPLVGYGFSVFIGAGILVLSVLAAQPLRVPGGATAQLLVPGTLFTILTGLFLIVARRKAITQVIGFLAMENGIYMFGVTFAVKEPWLVQAGVLLDVFAAVFVMGIIIHRINREFDHIDTYSFSDSKE